jgi:hypothetical protein
MNNSAVAGQLQSGFVCLKPHPAAVQFALFSNKNHIK